MNLIISIFLNNIFPLFIMILLGMLLNRSFKLDIFTLSKFNFYIFVPAFIFFQMYTTKIPLSFFMIPVFTVLLMITAGVLSFLITRLGRYPVGIRNAFLNSVMYFNTANFGLPLITLVFRDSPYYDQVVTIQVLIILVQTIAMNTLGFMAADQGKMHWKVSLSGVLKMPNIYMVVLAFLLKLAPVRLETFFFWPTVEYLKNGMIPLALTLLGIQLGRTRFSLKDHRVYAASLTRLIFLPLAAFGLIRLLGFTGAAAQALLIASAAPTALTTALIALERNNEPDFASQAVLTSSFFCIFTLTFVISIAGKLFPL